MAYESKNLSVLCYSNGFTLWHYSTTDEMNEVDSDGYFNDAATMLREGDMIMTNVDTEGTPNASILLVASSKDEGVSMSGLLPPPSRSAA